MLEEFREFALEGNMVDMAIGIVIGGAFGIIVKSLVDDVLVPPLGLAIGGVDFSASKVLFREAVGETPAVTINYGSFINSLLAFLVVAVALFLVVRTMNRLKRKEEAAPAAPPKQEVLLEEIRDRPAKSA